MTHVGHILSSDLSDNLDIIAVKQGMCRKENHMLIIFRSCDPYTKTKLKSYAELVFLSMVHLYGWPLLLKYGPWRLPITIWNLPHRYHTAILHRIAEVSSKHVYNIHV